MRECVSVCVYVSGLAFVIVLLFCFCYCSFRSNILRSELASYMQTSLAFLGLGKMDLDGHPSVERRKMKLGAMLAGSKT